MKNRSRGGAVVARARWCAGFLCKLRGLSFQRRLAPGTGLILVERRDGRWMTAIHMFGMLFALGIIWLDGRGTVVDARRAAPWRVYLPAAAARYTLETHPEVLERVAVGDVLEWSDEGG